jgi:exodeoxyribonuclease VII large subunit
MSAPIPPSGIKVFGVGELTRDIKRILEEAHGTVWVEGEVSNLARPSSGHLYLTLKDEEAPLRAMVHRGVALRLRFDLQDGMKVITKGRLSVFVPRGEYQLQIEEIHPKGVGPLELAFRQLKEKLSARGYFLPARKKKLPRIPRRIALVTSATGAAVRDMLEVLNRRWPAVEVWVCPSRIQGEGAAEEIAQTIGRINRISEPIDVIILGRGGGSLEDLWSFNEEIVAQAIYASRVPVVTGIGHETDLTIADLVADRRALTPSEAAEVVVPDRTEVLAWLANLEGRLRSFLSRNLERARGRLEELASRRCLREPTDRIREAERRVDDLAERLDRTVQQHLARAEERLQAQAARLESLSPLNVLARGYSLTRRLPERQVVRSADQVQPGDLLLTTLRQGDIVSVVVDPQKGKTPS